MKYFTSDLHLGHKNMVRGVTNWKAGFRDFDTIDQMNDAVIDSINDTIKDPERDELFILGDFAMGLTNRIPEYRDRIECQDIKLIYGNHDKAIMKNRDYQKLFTWCRDKYTVRLDNAGGLYVVLFHYYIGGSWEDVSRGTCHLFGHSHGNLPKDYVKGKAFDIGWDVWRRPLSEIEVAEEFSKLEIFLPPDHHK